MEKKTDRNIQEKPREIERMTSERKGSLSDERIRENLAIGNDFIGKILVGPNTKQEAKKTKEESAKTTENIGEKGEDDERNLTRGS
jgi:hypothetical protein